MQVIGSVKPDALSAGSVERHEVLKSLLESIQAHVANLNPQTTAKGSIPSQESETDEDSEETRRNAMSMFHQPVSKS